MQVPVKNIVERVDLTSQDALLPLFECVVNSIISLLKSDIKDIKDKQIQIKIRRGDLPSQINLENIKTIHSITITDNGVGFDDENFKSFETPYSNINKEFGCKGIGRFTVLAAFKSVKIYSNFKEEGIWKHREFSFDSENEVDGVNCIDSNEHYPKTTVELIDCFNPIIKDKTARTVEEIAKDIMQHCLIYYLSGSLPVITVFDTENNQVQVINDLFKQVSKEREKEFEIDNQKFKAYVTKSPKEGNRINHYVLYCANSRVVGQPRNISKFNQLFSYPVQQDGKQYFLDIYLVSEYLNKKAYNTRNGFAIPREKERGMFNNSIISFQEIEESLTTLLEEEYEPHVKLTQERSLNEIRTYITNYAPRYRSLLNNAEVLKSIPPNLSDDKKEEFLYKISYNARRTVEKNVQDFINNKKFNEESILKVKKDIQEKTAYDVDSLADYMTRRKAIIDLFAKFLEADSEGKYRLEEDIHNLIFPMGVTSDDIDYESHNLWLLDERFLGYKFIASDKSITSISQKKSNKEPDLVCIQDKPKMFDNPMGFGDKSHGELNSLVIFEFKRPGETAHQKNKGNYRWEFSDLIDVYFDDFIYTPDKKNHKGRQVIVKNDTPKFGYIIVDVIPTLLEDYNKSKGWKKTPFGSFYKMNADLNLHYEVMTFDKLLEYAKGRHMPFFNKLFGGH
ncbi:hypothetical protein [Spirosoma jeollabukense]